MKVSMYELAVPTLSRALDNLARILEKAAAHCEARKIDPAVLLASRLYPDMFPLGKQVQIAADAAKGGVSRLAQVEPPVFEDNETTFAELAERCRKTVAYLATIDAAKFEGCEDRTVTWKTRKGEKSLQGMPYLLTHVMPNLFFHATTAYGILRHNGVELGKGDFLGTR